VLAQQTYANGKLIVAGGSTASLEIGYASYPTSSVASAFLLNSPGGTSWSAASAMPYGRVGGYAATINGKVYYVGGHTTITQTAFTFSQGTLEFDPVNNTYTPKAAPITPVTGAACATVGSKIYMFGGLSLDDQGQLVFGNWCQVYDVTNNTWEQYATPAPYSQFYGTATAVGEEIYMVGGTAVVNGSAVALKTAYKGVVTANNITWTPIKDYPIGVASAAAGTLNGKMYIAGGQMTTGATNKTYRYDAAGNKWEPWYALPVAVANVNTLVNDGTSLFYISGSNSKKVYKLSDGASQSVAAIDQNAFYVTTTTGVAKTIQVRITNNGVAALEGGVNVPAEAQGWMSTTSGTFNGITAGGSQNLTLTLGGAGVATGNYHAVVMINTNDPSHAQVPVNVYFYVRDVLPQQATKVVVEEGTGTWCGYCPDGHRRLAAAEEEVGEENVLSMAYHGYTGTDDPYIITQGEALINNLGLAGYPNAAIQRWLFPGEPVQMTNRGTWAPYIAAVLSAQPIAPMELKILSYKYNASTKQVTAKIQGTSAVAIPMSPNTKFRLSAMLTQDSINHRQTEYTATGTIYNDPYAQRHVVRGVFPDQYGVEMAIPDGSTEENVLLPGTVFTQEITFSATNTTDVPRSEVTFVLHRTEAGNKLMEIYQGARLHLNSNIDEGGGTVSVAVNTPTSTKQISATDTAKFQTSVKNNGTAPVQVTVSRTETSLPNGSWTTWFCVDENCTQSGETSIGPVTVAPGETKNITVHIKGTNPGEGRVTLHFDYGSGAGVDQQYTATIQGAGVNDPMTGANVLRLSQNTPNPATTFTSFNYALPKAGTVTIELFNMSGEKVNGLVENNVEAGAHTFEVNVSTLPSGTYSVRLSSNGSSVSRMISVTR
jgi:N-acetylneuraminic acid mutarotase